MEKARVTVREFVRGLSVEERKLFAEKLHTWLGCYTDEIVKKVLLGLEDIINNEHAMMLIDELYQRTKKEIDDEKDDILNALWFELGSDDQEKESLMQYGIHNHPLEHANAYRHILYDMYIK